MSSTDIINTYDQNCAAGGDRVVIYNHPQQAGRVTHGAKYQIGRVKNGRIMSTDLKAVWYDYGKKTFNIWRENGESLKECRARTLKDAVAWADAQFGKREYVKNRSGDYVEKEVNEKFPIPKRPK